MRLTLVFTQTKQHGSQTCTCAGGQGQSRQGIDCIVSAPNAQCVSRHQSLDVNFFHFPFAQAACFICLKGPHQPGHAVDSFQTKIARALRHFCAKGDVLALNGLLQFSAHRFWQHGHHASIVSVQYHEGIGTKYFFFGSCVGFNGAVPIQMILCNVQDRGCRGIKGACIVKLKTGQL